MKASKIFARGALCAPILALTMSAAVAAYPDQPIHVVVGYSAGGTTDILARALGEQLSQVLKTPVVIENKPGAAGSIAAAYVANAKPDGYTLFIATVSSHGINPAVYKKLGYDPVKGFAPVSMLASIPLVLITNPKLKLKTVQDLVDLIRAKPGMLNYSSSGNGSPVHIAGAMFVDQAHLKAVHVPYRGGALANTAVIAGDVQYSFATLPAALPQIKAGTVTALAVTTKKRSPQLPDVPTVAENKNFPNYEINTWNALLAPAGTPEATIKKLNAAVVQAMGTKKLQTTFTSQGAEPESSTPQALQAFIGEQLAHWKQVMGRLGIHFN
jgi:tripartite-type tricarboxylate transporter receptor subunit TctC